MLGDLLGREWRAAAAVHLEPPHEGGTVHEGVRALFHDGGADDVLVDLDGVGVFALRQLEEGLVPGEVDVEGGAAVVALEPVAEEVAAVNRVAFLEVDMCY